MWAKLPVTSLTPFTFQDFPEHTACILWFSGCNMACAYCHNPDLVTGAFKRLPSERIEGFLESRRGLLEGVVLSGGECTLSSALPWLCRKLKAMGFKVKIDTNGSRPDRLEALLGDDLIDFVALDFKAPKTKYRQVTHLDDWASFERSLRLLIGSDVGREVRTTVHTDLLDEHDVDAITSTLQDLGYQNSYVVQGYKDGPTLGSLAPQKRRFDRSRLAPRHFPFVFRNME
ncbi:anaerobic ribonucleoside-triphosphate reductase activating protein [Asticcacaulis sp. BYS171W]|uniref:Anaerobic ribonucleoside-triphosphate reductase activating protein n=1 Tax=Asticcacaulis aquaticus TaxID=2984212 RepID=A0ABT5HWL9_9CAUL|nr:anaerobic ribonucleoside-triphosphate reductase activating protein [Asticcacaulis aquaticus]MDC7684448.1 anaerobic ribonucleoside-triphosphate reductase activating protein [Asticcacaulis aquaticus]